MWLMNIKFDLKVHYIVYVQKLPFCLSFDGQGQLKLPLLQVDAKIIAKCEL